jgi:hypothetical protein
MSNPIGKPAAVSDEKIFTASAKKMQFVNPAGSENRMHIRSYGREGLTGRGDYEDRKKRFSVADEMVKSGRPLK